MSVYQDYSGHSLFLVSVFYAEHYDKRISFCAHIWTKSKFLGLSIGVHHVGQGCISLSDYDEEYIITFPNAYGRSLKIAHSSLRLKNLNHLCLVLWLDSTRQTVSILFFEILWDSIFGIKYSGLYLRKVWLRHISHLF